MKKIKKWWESISPTCKQQIFTAICIVVFLGIGLFILSEFIWGVKSILPFLLLGLLLFGDNIGNYFQRQKLLEKEQKKQQIARMQALYCQIASSVVLPAVLLIWNKKMEVDILYYFASPAYGDGFYYQLPSACEGRIEKVTLQRNVERKLSAFLKCPFPDIIRQEMVSIYGDILVIRIP